MILRGLDSRFHWILDNWVPLIIIPILIIGMAGRIIPLYNFNPILGLPIYGGGLYAAFAQAICDNGGWMPQTILNYTDSGVPFVYPPLIFYFLVGMHTLFGISFISQIAIFPSIFSATLVPVVVLLSWVVSRDRLITILTSMILAFSPSILLLIYGNSLVQSVGALLLASFIISTIYFYNNRSIIALTIQGILLGLNILTSPGGAYAALLVIIALCASNFVLSSGQTWRYKRYLWIIIVAGLITAPYWVTVLFFHGWEPFINGFSARQQWTLLGKISGFLNIGGVSLSLLVPTYLGVFLEMRSKRIILPSILILLLLLGGLGVLYLIPVLTIPLAAIGIAGLIRYFLANISPPYRFISSLNSQIPIFLLSSIILLSIVSSVIIFEIVQSNNDNPGGNSFGKGTFYANNLSDEELAHLDAMRWAGTHTSDDSKFLLIDVIWSEAHNHFWIGDWFPYISNRTAVNTFYGSEWTDRKWLWTLDNELSEAKSINEVFSAISQYNLVFNYIYIPKYMKNEDLIQAIICDPKFSPCFENKYVLIYKFQH